MWDNSFTLTIGTVCGTTPLVDYRDSVGQLLYFDYRDSVWDNSFSLTIGAVCGTTPLV